MILHTTIVDIDEDWFLIADELDIKRIAEFSLGNVLIAFYHLITSSFNFSKQLLDLYLLCITSLVKYAEASSNPSLEYLRSLDISFRFRILRIFHL